MAQTDVSNPAGVIVTADSDASGDDGTTTIETKPGVSGLRLNFDRVLTLFGNKMVLGDASLANAARIELATQSPAVVSFETSTFNWTNGPAGEQNYKNNTFAIGYNQGSDGNAPVAGEVTVGFHVEPKYSQAGGPFQTEVYWDWSKPDGTGYIRPWGFNVAHDTGRVTQFIQGDIYLMRNNGSLWGLWYENGQLDLSYSPAATLVFANNTGGLRWRSASGSNTLVPTYIDNQDRTVLGTGGGGSDVLVASNNMFANVVKATQFANRQTPTTYLSFDNANQFVMVAGGNVVAAVRADHFQLRRPLVWETDNTQDIGKLGSALFRPKNIYVGTDVDAGGSYKVAGKKVVGSQCAPIPNSNGTHADDTRAINAILACMRAHGLVAK